MLDLLRVLTPSQRSAVLASYLGWMLDAFDFFILAFIMDDIAAFACGDLRRLWRSPVANNVIRRP
jgi:hypothetical protein